MWSSLCVVFLGFSAWAVSWLPVLPTLLHPSPAVLLLHLVWRCHRVSGCPLCLQSYHQQERTLGSSRRQEPICPTLERLTSVTANAKVNVSFSFCKTKVFLNVSNRRFFYAEVFPIQMEGVRLTVNKGLSNHFQVSQCVSSAHSHVSVQLIWPFFLFLLRWITPWCWAPWTTPATGLEPRTWGPSRWVQQRWAGSLV